MKAYGASQALTRRGLLAMALLLCMHPAGGEENRTAVPPVDQQTLEEWRAMRFGMFIHWGPVSLEGTEIGWSRGAGVPAEKYDNLYRDFNPEKFDADEWVRIARDAGMKYMIITSKHHDGFSLFDSKLSDYDIMATPFGRDVCAELAEACRRQGLRFGLYHSICDWYHPDYPTGSPGGGTAKPNPDMEKYVEFMNGQLRELAESCGPLLTFWFDGGWEAPWNPDRGDALYALCRELQPHALVNNRVKNASDPPGDYSTPEQHIGSFDNQRPWETCMTICRQWAWKPDDPMKSLEECIQTLVRTAGGDGNLLFNVGPMPDGRIEPRQVERLREMGQWLEKYGHTVYETRGGPFYPDRWGVSTHRGDRVFLHVMNWTAGDSILLPAISRNIEAAKVLSGGKVSVKQDEQTIAVTLDEGRREDIDTVIELRLDGPVTEMAALRRSPTPFDLGRYGEWISRDATYTLSSKPDQWNDNYDKLLKDEDFQGRWAFHSDEEVRPHIVIDLGEVAEVKGIEVWNRAEPAYYKRAESLTAWVSTDGKDWKEVWKAQSAEEYWGFEVTHFVAGIQQPGVKARYVKLGLTDEKPGYLHLKQVRVFGER